MNVYNNVIYKETKNLKQKLVIVSIIFNCNVLGIGKNDHIHVNEGLAFLIIVLILL